MMTRRELIALLASTAAVSWTGGVRAQQGERTRHIGVFSILAEADPESRVRRAAFEQSLQALGWINGSNLRIDYRWAANDAKRVYEYARELAALSPEVILTSGTVVIAPTIEAARGIIPVVFVQAVDPVGAGFVESLARPGGNVTGFVQYEYSLAGKWLELLKEVAPHVSRVAVIRDPTRGPGTAQFAAAQAVAPSLGVELTPINARDVGEMERGLTTFARAANGGLIVTSGGTAANRQAIIPVAERFRLPAVYPYRYYAVDGGLISYGPNTIDQYRGAAAYIDRILKGEKPADLPVQAPTKYELVVNLRTAKALGLEIPPSLLARADEVIE